MPRYILIDQNSGFVWNEPIEAADPIAACRAVDEGLQQFGRGYIEHGPRSAAACTLPGGYFVHVAPPEFQVGAAGGQDAGVIAEVAAMPCVAFVEVEEPHDP